MSSGPTKGREIRFIKGTYAGRKGWIDASRKKTKSTFRHVIVEDDGDGEKFTRVKKTSYREPFKLPTSYEEAAMQQHPDIEKTMILLAEMLASCGIGTHNAEVHQLLEDEIQKANTNLEKAGSKARFRNVEWVDPFEEAEEEGDPSRRI